MIQRVTSMKTLTLFLHMQSSILAIHDTCGNIKRLGYVQGVLRGQKNQ